jgi:hypothetical protein
VRGGRLPPTLARAVGRAFDPFERLPRRGSTWIAVLQRPA